MNTEKSPFAAIISGEEEGTIVARDDERRFALIVCREPEAEIHWLAVPFEYDYSTEEMKQQDRNRFLDLVDYAIAETRALSKKYPQLHNGFTVKFHIGSFETIPHAKLHILSTE